MTIDSKTFVLALQAARRTPRSTALRSVVAWMAVQATPRDAVIREALAEATPEDPTAVAALTALIADGAAGSVAALLPPDNAFVRMTFAAAAAAARHPGALPYVERLAGESHPRVRAWALRALQQIPVAGPPAPPISLDSREAALTRLLCGVFTPLDVLECLQTDAVECLHDTLRRSPSHAAALVDYLAGFDHAPDERLIALVSRVPGSNGSILLDRYAQHDAGLTAISVLGQRDDDAALQALIRLTRSADVRRQQRAWTALVNSPAAGSIEYVAEHYLELDDELRAAVGAALAWSQSLLSKTPIPQSILVLFAGALKDPSEVVRGRVHHAAKQAISLLDATRRARLSDAMSHKFPEAAAVIAEIARRVVEEEKEEEERERDFRAASAAVARAAREERAPAPVPAPPPAPPPKGIDAVSFSITAPGRLRPGQDVLVEFWAYVAAQRPEMLERVKAAYGTEVFREHGKGPVSVERESMLGVVLDVPAFDVRGLVETILWTGEIASCAFPLHVPDACAHGTAIGTARVLVGGFAVAAVHFRLEVGPTAVDAPQEVTQETARARRAFASYASADRGQVLARVQGMLKMAPMLNVFLDVVSLRSGERWLDRVRAEILNRDIFFLFWSEAASQSRWVTEEWQLALKERGLDYISPVPLVSPAVAPPPRPLAALHFNDWTLSVR